MIQIDKLEKQLKGRRRGLNAHAEWVSRGMTGEPEPQATQRQPRRSSQCPKRSGSNFGMTVESVPCFRKPCRRMEWERTALT